MELIQLFIQNEGAPTTLDELGNLGVVQFRDLNHEVNAFHRNFVNELRKADELLRRIRYLEDLIKKANINVESLNSSPHHDHHLLGDSPISMESINPITELDSQLEELEKEFRNLTANKETLSRNKLELLEFEQVMIHLDSFYDTPEDDETGLLEASQRAVNFVSGVISRDKMANFERILWRTTRGNIFLRKNETPPLIDPNTGVEEGKYVFAIFVQGQTLRNKVNKVCESFGAHLHTCPENTKERHEELTKTKTRIMDLDSVLERTEKMYISQLTDAAVNIREWKERVLKEKAIYHAMNMMNYDVGRKCLVGEAWCPKDAIEQVHDALSRATKRTGGTVPSVMSILKPTESPPTYFKTNKYTEPFQNIVDSYGVARYREVNPTVFALITFPFLFGVMFGDIGHGLLMTIAALCVIRYEDILGKMELNEMADMVFKGRYLIFGMGMFSIYTGLLYNDCFSIPIDWFGSNWEYANETVENAHVIDKNWVYPFGVDPGWKGAENELDFYNSLKMKISVILGVSQMVLGICLSAFNALHFKKPYTFYFEFIPQVLFMLVLFGYMCVLIIIKWLKDWDFGEKEAPYLLTTMIDIFLSPTSIEEDDQLYSIQVEVQMILVAIAMICIPMMLFPKPLLLKRDHENKYKHIPSRSSAEANTTVEPLIEQQSHEEEFDFNEVMVHQVIHTIEFVLGAISNTASYLRLWALSLAHAQLSTVFWEMVLILGVGMNLAGIGAFVCFAIWATLTVCVLMIMESLSAFLHALRLHWVEFMGKFYAGDGKLFVPFSYKRLLASGGEDEEFE